MEHEKKPYILFSHNPDGEIAQTRITRERLGQIFFNEENREWNNIHLVLPEPVWDKIYEDGCLIYEGFTIDQKAFGAGKAFYRDGTPMAEGIFGIKGLLYGREYYPSGIIRFEGSFRLNQAYGPNYPIYGSWFDEEGKLLFHGKFEFFRSSLGYPLIDEPKGFNLFKESVLKGHIFMWVDARKYMAQYQKDNKESEKTK